MQHHCAKSMPLSQSLAKHIGGKFSGSVFAGCNMGCAIFLFTGYCAAAWLRQEVCPDPSKLTCTVATCNFCKLFDSEQLDLSPHDVADGCAMLNSQTFSVLIVCNLYKVLMTFKDLFKV